MLENLTTWIDYIRNYRLNIVWAIKITSNGVNLYTNSMKMTFIGSKTINSESRCLKKHISECIWNSFK